LVLPHDFQEGFLERKALRREFEDIDIRSDKITKNLGKRIHGTSGEDEKFLLELGGRSP
jgi:SMC interacting uncharacterized protein involved in chromosome segregation